MEILALQTRQILLILLLVALIVAGLFFAVRLRRTIRLLGSTNVKDGQVADAVVLLSEEHQGSYLQGNAYFTFQVHVKPARGRNFVTEIHVLREQLKRIPQAGDHISVRYNYSGRKRTVVMNLDKLGSV